MEKIAPKYCPNGCKNSYTGKRLSWKTQKGFDNHMDFCNQEVKRKEEASLKDGNRMNEYFENGLDGFRLGDSVVYLERIITKPSYVNGRRVRYEDHGYYTVRKSKICGFHLLYHGALLKMEHGSLVSTSDVCPDEETAKAEASRRTLEWEEGNKFASLCR